MSQEAGPGATPVAGPGGPYEVRWQRHETGRGRRDDDCLRPVDCRRDQHLVGPRDEASTAGGCQGREHRLPARGQVHEESEGEGQEGDQGVRWPGWNRDLCRRKVRLGDELRRQLRLPDQREEGQDHLDLQSGRHPDRCGADSGRPVRLHRQQRRRHAITSTPSSPTAPPPRYRCTTSARTR